MLSQARRVSGESRGGRLTSSRDLWKNKKKKKKKKHRREVGEIFIYVAGG